MKGAPELAGHGPSGRGGPRSTRPRPQPLVPWALPVGEMGQRQAKGRAVRRVTWRQARRSEAVQVQAWLMSVGLAWRARLYPPMQLYSVQLYSVIARQGPPAHLTGRGGKLGFSPGLLGIPHGIAHEAWNRRTSRHNLLGSNTRTKASEISALRSRGRHADRQVTNCAAFCAAVIFLP